MAGYQSIDLTRAGPLGTEAYNLVNDIFNAIAGAFEYAMSIYEDVEFYGNPVAKQMVDEIQALGSKANVTYNLDALAWRVYIAEAQGRLGDAQSDFNQLRKNVAQIQAGLDSYVSREAYATQQAAAAKEQALAAEAAAQAAYQAELEQAYAEGLAREQAAAEEKRLAALRAEERRKVREAKQTVIEMQPTPIELFPEGSPVFPEIPYMPRPGFEIDTQPQQRFIDEFSGFGFDPRLVAYLARQAELSALDAGVFYTWNPDTQTFTGGTMMGPITVTLETMMQRAGITPVKATTAAPFAWFDAEQFKAATAEQKARAYASYRARGKTDAEIRQAAEYVFGPQRDADWQVLQQMAEQITVATMPTTQPAGGAGAIALAALAAALLLGA